MTILKLVCTYTLSVKRPLEDATSEQPTKVARTDFNYQPTAAAADSATEYYNYYGNYPGFDYNYGYGYGPATGYPSNNQAYDPTETTY